MDRHLSRTALVRVFSGRGTQSDAKAAVRHMRHCGRCWDLAASVIDELRSDSVLVTHPPDSRASVLTLLEEEDQQALDQLRTRGWWAELRGLSRKEQVERIRSVSALQTQEMFETIVSEASANSGSDPHAGEETALTAYVLGGLLPEKRYSTETKNDLQGEALIVAANCRRLAADWSGSQAALREARNCLKRGTGDPSLEARRLSISASLASDTGNLEVAQDLLAQAAVLYRESQDATGLASVVVQEAGTLLAAFRCEEALHRAEEALRMLTSKDVRLEMLARSILTECLLELGRPAAALRSFMATRPIYEQFRGRRDQLNVGYMEARLLDLCGCFRESEGGD